MGSTGGWIAFVTASVQLLVGLAGKVYLSSDSRQFRKIERDAGILAELPTGARETMEQLLCFEVNEHASRRMRIARRQVKGSTVVALLIVAGFTTGIGWIVARLAILHSWGWWIPFGLVALLGLLVSTAGLGQLYQYPTDQAGTTKNGGASVAQQPSVTATKPVRGKTMP